MKKLIVTLFAVLVICGCAGKDEDYSRYRLSNDLNTYEYGIDKLIEQLNEKEQIDRLNAALELGEYSRNVSDESRNILLNKAVPALIDRLHVEDYISVRVYIIRALRNIKPNKNTVTQIYLESIRKGYIYEREVLEAILGLKEIKYDLTVIAKEMVKYVEDDNISRRIYGLRMLRTIGKDAFHEIVKLEEIRDNQEREDIRNLIDSTIEHIKEEYLKYMEHEELVSRV